MDSYKMEQFRKKYHEFSYAMRDVMYAEEFERTAERIADIIGAGLLNSDIQRKDLNQ